MNQENKILHGNLAKVSDKKKIDPSYLANALTDNVTKEDGNVTNRKALQSDNAKKEKKE
jgi:hypothetical protein